MIRRKNSNGDDDMSASSATASSLDSRPTLPMGTLGRLAAHRMRGIYGSGDQGRAVLEVCIRLTFKRVLPSTANRGSTVPASTLLRKHHADAHKPSEDRAAAHQASGRPRCVDPREGARTDTGRRHRRPSRARVAPHVLQAVPDKDSCLVELPS